MAMTKEHFNFLLAFLVSLCVFLGFYYYSTYEQDNRTRFFVDKQGNLGDGLGNEDVVAFGIFFFKDNGLPYGPMGYNALRVKDLNKPLKELLRKIGVGGRGRFVAPYGEYIPDSKPSKFPQDKPVSAEVEFLFKIPFDRVAETGRGQDLEKGLLILDHGGIGKPDILGDRPWQKKNSNYMDVGNCRPFSMDGKTTRLWEWVAPGSSLLLYGGGGDLGGNVTGEALIGTGTGLQAWDSSYDVLKMLDTDGNGELAGAELDELFVWNDKNVDGRFQDGEIQPAASVVSKISTQYTKDNLGGRFNPEQGATLKDGRSVGTWEFYSRGETLPYRPGRPEDLSKGDGK
jgi:hypothetical protein